MSKDVLGPEIRDRMIYPDVVASTVMGDDGRYFATVSTNNNQTAVKMHVYWYIPDEGEPVLVVEVDDEPLPYGSDNSDIKVRVRRNDGLVYEGTEANSTYIEEKL